MPRLLLNPSAGHGHAEALRQRVQGTSDLEVLTPSSAEALTREARRAAEDGHDRIVVAGGDGTWHRAMLGLAGTDCALGLVPLGSGNDLARALRVPRDPLTALEHALTAGTRRIDLGRIDDQPYVGVAGIGFDADVARFARERMRRFRGSWIYPYAVLRILAGFRPPRFRIAWDGGAYDAEAMFAAVANTPCYGGGMQIAPAASLDDGLLDLVIVERVSKLRLVTLFPRVYRGAHVDLPEFRTARVRSARIRLDRDQTFFADGEPLVPSRAGRETHARVWPAALAVVA